MKKEEPNIERYPFDLEAAIEQAKEFQDYADKLIEIPVTIRSQWPRSCPTATETLIQQKASQTTFQNLKDIMEDYLYGASPRYGCVCGFSAEDEITLAVHHRDCPHVHPNTPENLRPF